MNCIIYAGRFQPFHNGHLECIQRIHKEYPEYPIFVFQILSLKNKKSTLPLDILQNIQIKVKETYSEIFQFIQIEPGIPSYLGTYVRKCREYGCEPIMCICGKDRKGAYEKQIEYVRKHECEPPMYKDFSIQVVGDDIRELYSGSEIRELLQNKEYEKIKDKVPECVFEIIGK